MGVYRRQVPVPRRAAAAGVNGPFDLGINPISYFVIHLDGVVAGVTAVGQEQPFTDIDLVEVLFNGAAVHTISGEDLRALLVALGWRVPFVVNHASAVDGDLVRVSIPVPFSRRRFWLNEGFPASRKGELQLRLTFAAEGATFQTRNIQIETIEMLDGRPERFLRYIRREDDLVVGVERFALPIGNDYVGVLIFEPTVAEAGFGTGSIGTVKFLLDNVEFGIASSLFEGMRDLLEQRGAPLDNYNNASLPQLAQYGLIDFDPLQNSEYLVPTIGRSAVEIEFGIDTADTIRVIPIELVRVETEQPAPITGGGGMAGGMQ